MAYMVSQRTSELGIRMALVAQRGHIFGIVIGRGMTLTGIGIVIGIGAASLLTQLMRSLLFGVNPNDPIILAGVSLLLLTIALLACLVPARRAVLIDPLYALRAE